MSNSATTSNCSSIDSGNSSSGVLRSHVDSNTTHTKPLTPSSDVNPTAAAPFTTPFDVPSPVTSNRHAHAAATLSVSCNGTVDNLNTPVRPVDAATAWFTSKLMESVNSTASTIHSASLTPAIDQSLVKPDGSRLPVCPETEQSYESFVNAELATIAESVKAEMKIQDSITLDSPFASAEVATLSASTEANVEIQGSIGSDGPSRQLLALAYGQQRMNLSTALEVIAQNKPEGEQTRPYQERLQRRAQAVIAAASERALALGIHNLKPELACREPILLIFSRLSSVHRRMCAGNIEKHKMDVVVLTTAEAGVGDKVKSRDVGDVTASALAVKDFAMSKLTSIPAGVEIQGSITLDEPSDRLFGLVNLSGSNCLNDKDANITGELSATLGTTTVPPLRHRLGNEEISKSGEMTNVEEIGSKREESCVLRGVSTNTLTINDFAWSDSDDEAKPTPAVMIDNIVTEEDEGVPEPVVAAIQSPIMCRVEKSTVAVRKTSAEDIRIRFEQWFDKRWNPQKKSIEQMNTRPNFNCARAVAYIKKAKKMGGLAGKLSLAKVKLAEEIIASAKNERVALALGHLQFVGTAKTPSTHAKIKYSARGEPEFTRILSERKYWEKVRVDYKISALLLKQGHFEKEPNFSDYFSELTLTPTPERSYARLCRRGQRLPCAIDTVDESDGVIGEDGSFLYPAAAPMRKINNNPDDLLKFKLFRTEIKPTTSAFTKQVVPLKKAIDLLVKGKIVLRQDSKSTVLLRQRALEVIAATEQALLEAKVTRHCEKDVCEEYIAYRQSICRISKDFQLNLAMPAFTSRFAFWAGVGVPHTEEEEQLLCGWFEARPIDVTKCEVKLRLGDAVKVVTKLAPRSVCTHPHWLAVVRSAESLLAKASERKLSIAMCKANYKRQAAVFCTEQAPVLETQKTDRVYMENNRALLHAQGNPTMSLAFYQRGLKRRHQVSKIYVLDSSDDETHTYAKEDFEGGAPSDLFIHHVACTPGAVAVSVTRSIVKKASPLVSSTDTALPPPFPYGWEKSSALQHPPITSRPPSSPALLPELQPKLHPVLVTKRPSQETESNKIESIKQVPSINRDSTVSGSFDTSHSLASLQALSESAMADAAAARAERQFLLNEIAFEKDLLREARNDAEHELEAVRKAFMENRMELKRIAVVTTKEKTHQHSLHAVEIEQKQVEMLYLEAERRPKLTEKYNLRKSVEMKESLLQSELKMQKILSSQVRQHEKFQIAYKQRTIELTQLRETREIAHKAELAARDISIQQLHGEIARASADSRANTHLHQNISKSQALLEAEDATVSTQLTSLQGKYTEQLQRKSRVESQHKQTWKEIYLEREAYASNVVEIAELHEDRHDLNEYFAWKEGQARMATDKNNQEMQELFDSFKT